MTTKFYQTLQMYMMVYTSDTVGGGKPGETSILTRTHSKNQKPGTTPWFVFSFLRDWKWDAGVFEGVIKRFNTNSSVLSCGGMVLVDWPSIGLPPTPADPGLARSSWLDGGWISQALLTPSIETLDKGVHKRQIVSLWETADLNLIRFKARC